MRATPGRRWLPLQAISSMNFLLSRLPRHGLWQHRDFLRLWMGQGVSTLGSMIGRPAMTFTAILVLDATPAQVALLAAMDILPGMLVGLHAGAWVDRLRRRPICEDLRRSGCVGRRS